MTFIEPSYEFMEIPEATDHMGVLKFIERIGRVCYKSEDRITDDSAIKFVEMIRDRKHWAILEHYIFIMEVDYEIYNAFILLEEHNSELRRLMKYINLSLFIKNDVNHYIISGSATAFNNIFSNNYFDTITDYDIVYALDVFLFLKQEFPELIYDNIYFDTVYTRNAIRFLSRDEIKSLPLNLRLTHDFMTVKYATDRGVSHELVRHRECSWAQESTRYVNYGKKPTSFIIPNWISKEDKEILLSDNRVTLYSLLNTLDIDTKLSPETKLFVESVVNSMRSYERLLNAYHWTAQQARAVLPNAIKTEIVQTCNLKEWVHFFSLRISARSHSQMRELTVPMFKELLRNSDSKEWISLVKLD